MPFERFQITSTLPPSDLAARLRLSVATPRWFTLAVPPVPFVGTVASDNFRVMRVIRGRDSFNPVLYGRFVPTESGTRICGFMTFHPASWAFLVLWNALIGGILVTQWRTRDVTPAILFLLLPWIMGLPMFYYNADGSLRLLAECLNARRTTPLGV